MDGYKKPKKNKYKGELYSDTRFEVIKFIQNEIPKLSGVVLNISAGGWLVPKQLLNMKKVSDYKTVDLKFYGDSKNRPDIIADVHNLPFKDNYVDGVINLESAECYENPHKAFSEIHRILKPGGVLIASAPFNHAFFGRGGTPESMKKKNPVMDYWRISLNGWELLLKDFSKVNITPSAPNSWDPYCYLIKAIKGGKVK